MVAIVSFLAPVVGEGLGFLRILRTLRLLHTYQLVARLPASSLVLRTQRGSNHRSGERRGIPHHYDGHRLPDPALAKSGKTTIARILARCLNCEKGPTDTPCGTCSSCIEISRGHSTDVQEIDAASRTSVDDVRELIESVRYAPSPGKHKIFVVDEVHMLSAAAFNALLKTLEEPPPRTIFVFATTNPEKIPFTVVSRCQRFNLRRIPTSEIAARLATIAVAEGVAISEASLHAIAREADGSLRDAQTLLDQVIALGGAAVDDDAVREMLDLLDRGALLEILRACVEADPARALAAVSRAAGGSADAKRIGEHWLRGLRDLVVLSLAPQAEGLVEGSAEEIAELRALAAKSDPTRLRRMFRALVAEQEDLAFAPQPLAVLEMAAVRLATLAPADDVARLLSRLEALEQRLAGGAPGDGEPPASAAGPRSGGAAGGGSARAAGAPARTAERGRRAEPAPPADARAAAPAPAPAPASASADRAADAAPAAVGAGEPDAAEPAGAHPALVFDRLRAYAAKESPALFAALQDGALLEQAAGRIRIQIPRSFAAQRLRDRQSALDALCTSFFGRETRAEVASAEELRRDAEGSAGAAGRDGEALRRLRQVALDHPGVNAALTLLGAEIVEIRPLASGAAPAGRSARQPGAAR